MRDVLTFASLAGSTICLMDINPERLEYSRRAVQRIVDEGGYPAKVQTTQDRVEALKGADYVLVTILVGATDVLNGDRVVFEGEGLTYDDLIASAAVPPRLAPRTP